MCYFLPAAFTFVNCVGGILRGWFGGGVRGRPHSFLNPRLPKVTYKILYFTNPVLYYIFSPDGFCALCCNCAFISMILLNSLYGYFTPLRTALTCLWQGASRVHSPDFRFTGLLTITELEHNVCGQANSVE